jgi:molybdate transport system substrate-binding protein
MMSAGNLPITALATAFLLATTSRVDAADVYLAIASNFATPAKELQVLYEQTTYNKLKISFGSSGKHFAQIVNGAPFELFLSADVARAKRAVAENYAVDSSRFTYAIGKLVLYSATPDLIDNEGKVLSVNAFNRLAIANPKTAPYGEAAVTFLRSLGLYKSIRKKIVTGENIAQTYQFVATGNADIGFVAYSQISGHQLGSRWLVPTDYYPAIRQQAVLLKKGIDNPAATDFLSFLKSAVAKGIIKKYGYEVD